MIRNSLEATRGTLEDIKAASSASSLTKRIDNLAEDREEAALTQNVASPARAGSTE